LFEEDKLQFIFFEISKFGWSVPSVQSLLNLNAPAARKSTIAIENAKKSIGSPIRLLAN